MFNLNSMKISSFIVVVPQKKRKTFSFFRHCHLEAIGVKVGIPPSLVYALVCPLTRTFLFVITTSRIETFFLAF